MKDEEESREQKQVWLVKLGCLLKLHGNIKEGEWFDLLLEPNVGLILPPDMFGDPWAYRISDFPMNYKLFTVKRQPKGDSPPMRDGYLCGMSAFFFPVCSLAHPFF